MADIVLATINAKWIHPSLALRLLKASLGPLEEGAEIQEFALRQPLAEKTGPILAASPRILALSVSIWNHLATLELLEELNRHWSPAAEEQSSVPKPVVSKPVIVLGGPEVSYLPPESPILSLADWVVRGEGEAVFPLLCSRILAADYSGEPGYSAEEARRQLGGAEFADRVKSVRGRFIDTHPVNLSAIDPGYRLYSPEDLERKLTYVEASRGCPFGCEFCLSSLDSHLREFPLDSFLRNMEILIERGGRSFKFLDRTFNLDIGRAERIMEFFLDRLKPSMYVHFEMVPSRFPWELRKTLTRFPPGSLRIELGIQTFNRESAALIGRHSDPAAEREALRFLRDETQAIVHADLIAGLPGEDFSSFGKGFDLLRETGAGEIQLGILKKLPGTPICRHDGPFNMVYSELPPYEVLETGALSAEELNRLRNFARFWELIVNRNNFEDLAAQLFPAGQPVFDDFMRLSGWLLARFGRNWGIDRKELRSALEEWAGGR